MWNLLNKFFGWDYIAWENSADSGISRIRKDASGKAYYWRYRRTLVADHVNKLSDVKLWFTCEPGKYLGTKE